ncbi:MAG: alpha/beta fold hydrolase [Candidatus Ozemobacteraceae bacterium]
MERRNLEIGSVSIPALICRPQEFSCRTESEKSRSNRSKKRCLAMIFHGLGGSKEVQKKEVGVLANAGFTAVAIDAPHHGERRSPFLDEMDGEKNAVRKHRLFIELVSQAAAEIPKLITLFRNEGFERIVVSGISLGGHTAFGAILHEPLPDALIPLIGSPDWGVADSPHRHLERFSRLPTMAIVGGKDTIVPAGPCRALFAALAAAAMFDPTRLQLREYPESGHCMRGEDWDDAWKEIIAFLDRILI